MKNILKLTSFKLYLSRKTIMGFGLAILLITTLYMILYPSIRDIAQEELNALPKEVLQLFLMDKSSDLTNYTSYFSMIYSLVILGISFFASIFSFKIIKNEEKNKTIEYLNSLSVSRNEIYISSFLTSFISILIVVLISCLTVVSCGLINGGTSFNLKDILNVLSVICFIPFFFGGLSLFLAGISSKKIGIGYAYLIVIISYVLGYIGNLLNNNVLTKFSPFITFNTNDILNINNSLIIMFLVYISICFIVLVIGNLVYKKRDFNI